MIRGRWRLCYVRLHGIESAWSAECNGHVDVTGRPCARQCSFTEIGEAESLKLLKRLLILGLQLKREERHDHMGPKKRPMSLQMPLRNSEWQTAYASGRFIAVEIAEILTF